MRAIYSIILVGTVLVICGCARGPAPCTAMNTRTILGVCNTCGYDYNPWYFG